MNMQDRLDQFREDNPYDFETQAKRLLSSNEKELVLYTLQLGLQTAKQRQRHYERDVIKATGEPPTVILKPGRVTGSVISIERKPSKRLQNIAKRLVMDVWMINGETMLGDANSDDLRMAVNKETSTRDGLEKNIKFYKKLSEGLADKKGEHGKIRVRENYSDIDVKKTIETVYGEFREQKIA